VVIEPELAATRHEVDALNRRMARMESVLDRLGWWAATLAGLMTWGIDRVFSGVVAAVVTYAVFRWAVRPLYRRAS
jgi:hypothetical protein